MNPLNHEHFHDLVIEDASDEDLATIAKGKSAAASNVQLAKVTQYVRESTRQKSKATGKYDRFLVDLEEYVRDRVVMILVRVGDEADAYLIFETLNDERPPEELRLWKGEESTSSGTKAVG